MSAIAGVSLGDPDAHPWCVLRVGICPGLIPEKTLAETRMLMERIGNILRRAGAALQKAPLPESFGAMAVGHPVIINSENARPARIGACNRARPAEPSAAQTAEMGSRGLRAGKAWRPCDSVTRDGRPHNDNG